jgi:DNA recombination protein RmuC
MDYPITLLLAFVSGLAIGGVAGGFLLHFRSQARVKQLESQREADADKIDWINNSQDNLRETFEALASKSLRSNSELVAGRTHEQLATHASQIVQIKTALEANISQLDKYVRELEQKREGAYQLLTVSVKNLEQAHTELRDTTDKLQNALRSGPTRGRWGEIQLRKIIELAGMAQHVSFDEQVTGVKGKPDVVVYLPNQGHLVVDSKFPLDAFLAAMTTIDVAVRTQKLEDHLKAVRHKIKELSDRKYWEEFQPSPELVVMFIPIESCLMAACECDPDIVEFALGHKVILATPVTLLGFMKAIAYGWQQFTISKNAKQILEQGWELYRRVDTWLEHYRVMGDKIGGVVEAYNKSVASLQTRFFPSARKFQDLAAIAGELTELATLECGLQLAPRSEEVSLGDGQVCS